MAKIQLRRGLVTDSTRHVGLANGLHQRRELRLWAHLAQQRLKMGFRLAIGAFAEVRKADVTILINNVFGRPNTLLIRMVTSALRTSAKAPMARRKPIFRRCCAR